MSARAGSGERRGLAAEGLLAGAVVLAAVWAGWRFLAFGYLPQPFLYDLNYPLMGLYDTAYWANHAGAYGPGRSIYPPLSFVFLRLVTRGACYALGPEAGRRCDAPAAWAMLGVFLLNIALVHRSFRPQGRAAALCRTTAVCLGLPMLYGLECANLIIVTFTFFVLAFGPVLRSAPLRWLSLGIAINFKPYLMVVWLASIVGRHWRWLAATVVATGLVYLLTWALQGGGSPGNLGGDLLLYAIVISHNAWSDVYYATSYWPLIHLMTPPSRLFGLVTAGQAGAWVSLLTLLIRTAQIGVVACLVAGARRPAAVDARRFCAMILALILTTLAPGQSGYVQIFVFFLVFFEPWRGAVRIAVLLCAYLLCVPADYVLVRLIHGPAWSYLGGREVTADFGLSLGQLVRPGLLLIVQYGLIALNLRDVAGRKDRTAPEHLSQREREGPMAKPWEGEGLRRPPSPIWAAARLHETKIRFLLSGAVNTLLGLAIFPALMLTLGRRGVHYMAILAISQATMVSVAYLSAKFLVFRTRGAYVREFARFGAFYTASFALNLAVLPLLVEVFHVRPIIAQTGFAVAIILTSYLWHSRVTFRPKGPGR